MIDEKVDWWESWLMRKLIDEKVDWWMMRKLILEKGDWLEREKVEFWESQLWFNWVLRIHWWKYVQMDKGSCWVAIATENKVFFIVDKKLLYLNLLIIEEAK